MLSLQESGMPVIYKLLTARDKAAQGNPIQMMTMCCHSSNDRRAQRQAWIAAFDNGAILLHLVTKVEEAKSWRSLSAARAKELSSILNLISLAADGMCCSHASHCKSVCWLYVKRALVIPFCWLIVVLLMNCYNMLITFSCLLLFVVL